MKHQLEDTLDMLHQRICKWSKEDIRAVGPVLGEKQPSFTSTDAYVFAQTNQLIETLKHDIVKCNGEMFD